MRRVWIAVAVGVLVVLAAVTVALFGLRPSSRLVAEAPEKASPVAAAPAATTVAASSSQSPAVAGIAVSDTDHVLGNRSAPVTIIEYASLTCPHCAHFHEATLPQLKSEFIDTGKAKLVFRDFPLDQTALRAASMAECVPADRYFGLLAVLFQGQGTWAVAPDPVAALARIGKLSGLSEEQANSCLTDEKKIDAVVAERLDGEKQYAIRSTPTFIVNGKKFAGALTIEQMRETINSMLP